jgi:Polyketide cyclase / dehydrase and lipid transport
MGDEQRAIVVSTTIVRPPAEVWQYVRVVERHVDWMHDAVAIRFLTDRTEGVGTRFECDTRVGPFSTTDVMEITAWEPERRMGVRHVGMVTGTGEFTMRALAEGLTEFRWSEDLRFPWYLGGAVGAFVARPVLRAIWRRNLAALKAEIEQPSAT